MATMDADAIFIDTNVLVYTFLDDAPLHATACRTLRECAATGARCWINRQVMREFLATLTRPQPFAPPFPGSKVASQARHFATRFHVAEDGPQVTERLLGLVEQLPVGGKRIHDANIVATMLTYRIPCILTHNIRDFASFSDLITVLPLKDK